jgi:hypothetical protein
MEGVMEWACTGIECLDPCVFADDMMSAFEGLSNRMTPLFPAGSIMRWKLFEEKPEATNA